jgi:hypothetical protein
MINQKKRLGHEDIPSGCSTLRCPLLHEFLGLPLLEKRADLYSFHSLFFLLLLILLHFFDLILFLQLQLLISDLCELENCLQGGISKGLFVHVKILLESHIV